MLRLPEVLDKTKLCRATVYSQQAAGIFPACFALSARAVGWLEHEVDAVINARAAGASDDELRALVKAFVEARAHAVGASLLSLPKIA